jgi:hypothetical protein
VLLGRRGWPHERGRFFHLSVLRRRRHYQPWGLFPEGRPQGPGGRSGLRPRPTMQASGVAAAAARRLTGRPRRPPPTPVRREGLGCTRRP